MRKEKIVRLFVVVILIFLFVVFYSIPAIQKYNRKETFVIRTKIPSSGIPAPAVTFCPRNLNTGHGWKDDNFINLSSHCSQYGEDAGACIQRETYSISDFLTDAYKGSTAEESLTDPRWWTQDLGDTIVGVCHTFYREDYIGTDYSKDDIFFFLNLSLNYRILIHDKDYFELTTNPLSIPMVDLMVITNLTFNHFHKLAMIEHRELNVPQDPCEDDPGYNFRACVKESFAQKVGCRTWWDLWSDQRRNVCTDLESYRQYDDLYVELNRVSDIGKVTEGCLKPCSYNKYKLLETKENGSNVGKNGSLTTSLWSVCDEIKVETEELVYPWIYLVGDFGGALAMFVGFSFMNVWDGMEMVWTGKVKQLVFSSDGES